MTETVLTRVEQAAESLIRQEKRCHLCKNVLILTNTVICRSGYNAGKVMAADVFSCRKFKTE